MGGCSLGSQPNLFLLLCFPEPCGYIFYSKISKQNSCYNFFLRQCILVAGLSSSVPYGECNLPCLWFMHMVPAYPQMTVEFTSTQLST